MGTCAQFAGTGPSQFEGATRLILVMVLPKKRQTYWLLHRPLEMSIGVSKWSLFGLYYMLLCGFFSLDRPVQCQSLYQ